MITAKELEIRQKAIQQKIRKIAKANNLENGLVECIPDGVADCTKYLTSFPRVAWVLKEPYDSFEEDGITPSGGGWLLYEGFLGQNKDWTKNITWQRIIYTMYGLRNKKYYDDMDYIRNKPDMGDVMKETVILDLSKMPAGTTSNYSFANNYKNYWSAILKEQIEIYDPQVVVFGNTFSSCWPLFLDADSTPIKIIKNPQNGRCFINLYKANGRFLLDAYHPGIRSNVAFYINSLIDTIMDCFPSGS